MSTPEVDLIRSDDPAWDERLEVVAHDVYHRAGYHRFAEASEGATAFLAVISGTDGARGVIWPYLLRSIVGRSTIGRRRRVGRRFGLRIPRPARVGVPAW